MLTLAPRSLTLALSSLLLVAPAIGCSDLGTHKLAIDGSDAVKQGIDMSATDGWAITFESFIVVVHNPGLIERIDNDPALVRESGVTVWNVVSGVAEGEELSRQIRATNYDGVQFRIAPPAASGYDAVVGNVPEDVVDMAVDEGWSIHVIGSAASAMDNISFDWTFDTNTFYRCELEGDEVLMLAADGDETTVIEILGEALFRSETDDPSSALVFQPIADADADNDGMVTTDELDAAGLLEQVTALSQQIGGVGGAGICPAFEG
jgi:hypothetical protein